MKKFLAFLLLCNVAATSLCASEINKFKKKTSQGAQSQEEQIALDSALIEAIFFNEAPSLSQLKKICAKGASINNCFVTDSESGGYLRCPTPLSIASSGRNIPAMKLFLKRGAKVDVVDSVANTPLINTIISMRNTENSVPAMQLLLAYGACPCIPDFWEKTPLSCIQIGTSGVQALEMQKFIKDTLIALSESQKKSDQDSTKTTGLRTRLAQLQTSYTRNMHDFQESPARKQIGALLCYGAKPTEKTQHLKDRAIATHRMLGIDFNQKVTLNRMNAHARARKAQKHLQKSSGQQDLDDEEKSNLSKVTEWPRRIA